ncbi:MAG: DUF1566 domain-containing protein [Pseudomonadales bacterium]|nr:DUF1566 domain-containing protein [Pseudomonadales bacterium]
MKIISGTFFVSTIISISAPLQAATIGELNTFDAGSAAIAAEVNGNFESVKKSVNDNATRIASLEGAKPGTGPQGQAGVKGPAGPAGTNGVDFMPVGAKSGDILFWNGSKWKLSPVPAKTTMPLSLTLLDGVPTWTAQGQGLSMYKIGDNGPAGGKVFYITDGGLHGLEAATTNQSDSTTWGCLNVDLPGANGTKVGTGGPNTGDVLASCGDAGIAAKIAGNFWLNGYQDWYLPSQMELSLLFQQKNKVGRFSAGFYWSSTESDKEHAWYQNFSNGNQAYNFKDKKGAVRAIRSF